MNDARLVIEPGGLFTRRDLLRLAALAAAAGPIPVWRLRSAGAAEGVLTAAGGYLTGEELAILDAATSQIMPSDSLPGARECGAINYIQSMLTFLPGSDSNCDRRVNAADLTATLRQIDGHGPGCRGAGDVDGDGAVTQADVAAGAAAAFNARPVFAGGPFSGRNPQPHFPTGTMPCGSCHGTTSTNFAASGLAAAHGAPAATVDNYPPNSFLEFLPLSRLHALSWQIRLRGLEAVRAALPAEFNNPLATEMVQTDLRRRYREGLASLDQISRRDFGAPFTSLSATQRATVFDRADQKFVTLLHYHTVEGMFCPPEYGGNLGRIGWDLIGFGGDSQPLGYAIYDESVDGHYRERPDKPNSTPNPGETCAEFSEKLQAFLNLLMGTLKPHAERFSCPYCLDVTQPCPPS